MPPGPEVLAGFGASAAPGPLPGGEGTAWRVGDIVLKPAGPPRAARWTADLYDSLAALPEPGFRVPRPVRAASGDWLAVGPAGAWVAWEWLAGEPADWSGVSPTRSSWTNWPAGRPELDQLLAHALVYRLVTEMIFRRDDPAGLEAAARAGRPVTDLILARLAAHPSI